MLLFSEQISLAKKRNSVLTVNENLSDGRRSPVLGVVGLTSHSWVCVLRYGEGQAGLQKQELTRLMLKLSVSMHTAAVMFSTLPHPHQSGPLGWTAQPDGAVQRHPLAFFHWSWVSELGRIRCT